MTIRKSLIFPIVLIALNLLLLADIIFSLVLTYGPKPFGTVNIVISAVFYAMFTVVQVVLRIWGRTRAVNMVQIVLSIAKMLFLAVSEIFLDLFMNGYNFSHGGLSFVAVFSFLILTLALCAVEITEQVLKLQRDNRNGSTTLQAESWEIGSAS